MCQVHTGAYHYSRLEKSTIPLAPQERLPRIYCTKYLSLRIRTTDASQLEKRNKEKKRRKRKGNKRQESEKTEKERKEKKDKKSNKRQDKRKDGKEKKKQCHTSRPWELTTDGIGLIEGIKCIINGTGEKTQDGEEVRAVLRYLVTAIGRPKNFKTIMAGPRL